MGEFAKKVRHGAIHGPTRPNFRPAEWKAKENDPTLDDTDRRILNAGIALGEILSEVRNKVGVASIDLRPDVSLRLVLGHALHTQCLLRDNQEYFAEDASSEEPFVWNSILHQAVPVLGGQEFNPDEIITGFGDGAKYLLRDLLRAQRLDGQRNENQVRDADVAAILAEINTATLYHSVVEIWNDCVGNGYELACDEHNVDARPSDRELAITYAVSMYRRDNMGLGDLLAFREFWLYRWSRAEKERINDMPLVVGLRGNSVLEKIELGKNAKSFNSASISLSFALALQHGYYRSLLDEPLPLLNNLTINEMIKGWRLLQSLAAAMVASAKPVTSNKPADFLRLARVMSPKLLCATFAKALSIPRSRAQNVIDSLTFTGLDSQDLWKQPLVRVADNYCLVVPTAYLAKLERIVEGWMLQGGLDLKRRGAEFENYCRDELADDAKNSPIAASIQVIGHEARYKNEEGTKRRIDIVIIIGSTILLIEAKCFVWPDDSLKISSYRDKVREAAKQAKQYKEFVQADFAGFAQRLRRFGAKVPDEAHVVTCVLTNSTVYAGFPVDDVPIVDLPMLRRYFSNKYVKIDQRSRGESVAEHAIRFYSNGEEAGENLEGYLLSPPQLSDMKEYVTERTVTFPGLEELSRRLKFHSYAVDLDFDAMEKKYPRADASSV